jgi:hypothetical protein
MNEDDAQNIASMIRSMRNDQARVPAYKSQRFRLGFALGLLTASCFSIIFFVFSPAQKEGFTRTTEFVVLIDGLAEAVGVSAGQLERELLRTLSK